MRQVTDFDKLSTILVCETVFLVETIHTSTRVNQLLLAGIERVTLGADFDANILLGGTGLDHFAAGTTNGGVLIIGMDASLHAVHLFHKRSGESPI